jgi:hypothetical protein
MCTFSQKENFLKELINKLKKIFLRCRLNTRLIGICNNIPVSTSGSVIRYQGRDEISRVTLYFLKVQRNTRQSWWDPWINRFVR